MKGALYLLVALLAIAYLPWWGIVGLLAIALHRR